MRLGKHERRSRRRFFRHAAVLGGIVASPSVLPAVALGLADRPAASQRIVVAHIGMGWFGTVDLKIFLQDPEVQNVAVCDVDAAKAAAAKDAADAHYHNRDCRIYRDFRELLGRPDLDVIGETGRIGFWYGGLEKTDPPSLMRETIGPNEIHLRVCPPDGHERGDFLTAVRTRGRPGADVEIGHRSVSVCHLAHIAYRLRRPLRWDPVKEEFPGDEEANRLCGRSMRAPWRL